MTTSQKDQQKSRMELIVKPTSRKRGTDCLVENMELSDHMIHESVRAHGPSGHHVSPLKFEYRRIYNTIALAIGDTTAITAALLITGALRALFLGEPLFQWWVQLVLPVWYVGAFIARLYPGWGLGAVEELRRQTLAITGVYAFAAVLLFWVQLGEDTSRFAFTLTWLLSIFLIPAIRRGVKSLLIKAGEYGLPVVIYGAGSAGREIVRQLDHERGLGYKPIAFLDDHPGYWGAHMNGVPVLGDTNLVLPDAQVAILAMPEVEPDFRRHLLEGPLSYYRNVIIIPDLNELPSLWVGTVDMGGTLGLRIVCNLADPMSRFVKRSFDLLSTFVSAPLWLPLVGLTAAAIWMEDRYNPFFLQPRSGHGGSSFNTWKFRTMVPDAEHVLEQALAEDPELAAEWESDFKLKNDPRITRVGRILRKFSLDEIPQLFNVLRGDMSLVGPRPLPAYHEEEFHTRARAMRRRVHPGVTGLWQVSGRSDIGTEGMEHLDSYYVRNWSVWLDVVILVRTFRAVLHSTGAY